MPRLRCIFCRKFIRRDKNNKRCPACEKEFNDLMTKINKVAVND